MPVYSLVKVLLKIILQEIQNMGTEIGALNPYLRFRKTLLQAIDCGIKELVVVEYADWVELPKHCDPDETEVLKDRLGMKLLGFFENFEQEEPKAFHTKGAWSISRMIAGTDVVSPELIEVGLKQCGFRLLVDRGRDTITWALWNVEIIS